jgi:hypothetical protein
MNIDNIISSTLKVTASADLNIQNDLNIDDSTKTLAQILNEEKEQSEQIEEKNSQN